MHKSNVTAPAKEPRDKDAANVAACLQMGAGFIERQLVWITDLVVDRAVPIVAGRVKALGTSPRLLSIPEAAERLGRTKGAVRNMLDRGQLRWVRPPGSRKRFIEAQEIERYIQRGRGAAQ